MREWEPDDELAARLADQHEHPETARTVKPRVSRAVREAAARSRVVADVKRGVDTPEWIRRLAESE